MSLINSNRAAQILRSFMLISMALAFTVPAAAVPTIAQDSKRPQKSATEQINQSTSHINNQQTFDLKYKMAVGETLRWSVEHIATTKTSMAGVTEASSSKSKSTQVWKTSSVDTHGNMTFVYSLDDVNMWNKLTDQDPVTYDSRSDKEPPDMFKGMADQVGVSLATITITPSGKVVTRNSQLGEMDFGVGDITIPFPESPVKIGAAWHVPGELKARHGDGRIKYIKTRLRYRLESVEDQLATISVKTEILTPIEDEKINSQIIQHLTNGEIVFDLAKGRLKEKAIQWNNKVQGFEGADSKLEYLARYVVQLRDGSVKPTETEGKKTSEAVIKPRDGNPIIRH